MSFPAYEVSVTVDAGTPITKVVTSWQETINHFFNNVQEGDSVNFVIRPVQVNIVE